MIVHHARLILIVLLASFSACGDGSSKEYTPPTPPPVSDPKAEPKVEVTPPSLITTGVRNQPLAAYEVPAEIRERLAPVAHEILPAPKPTEAKFSVFNQHIDIKIGRAHV